MGAASEDAPVQDSVPQYRIAAAGSLRGRGLQVLKHDDTFGLFETNGDISAGDNSPLGIFHKDTRHLSDLSLTLSGAVPMLLRSSAHDGQAMLTWDLTNPAFVGANGEVVIEHDLIHLRRSRFLSRNVAYERLTLRSYDDQVRNISLRLQFAADFADVFEVRGVQRSRRGTYGKTRVEADQVTLAYSGLDGCTRTTALRFDPVPDEIAPAYVVFDLALQPNIERAVFIEVSCNADPMLPARRAFVTALRDAHRSARASRRRTVEIESSNPVFDEVIRRSTSDLAMLMTETPFGPCPYVGIPWFSALFGRDAIITALEMLWFDPHVARGVLANLAANQADVLDAASDAEPGKIVHEIRHGEMAALGEVPFRRYYGSANSTPLFVMLAGAYLERTGDVGTVAKLWPNIERALKWIEEYGDADHDGFVEYGRRSNNGLANQGWKDGYDAVFHDDGTLASGPIAICEIQSYVYGAYLAAATIAVGLGQGDRADRLKAKAAALRLSFDQAFWDEENGVYALALDGAKRPCRVRSSNAGHVLLTGLALPTRAAGIAHALMQGTFFSGWGLRTIASTEARYNPMSYHNGSVWPHDNAMIAAGLARYGFKLEVSRIFAGLFAAAADTNLRRLPELSCGFARRGNERGPTPYPVACSPQAWAAGAPLSLLQSCLGLAFHPSSQAIILDRPKLPAFLEAVVVRRLSMNGAEMDIALHRDGEQVSVSVVSRRGEVGLVVTH